MRVLIFFGLIFLACVAWSAKLGNALAAVGWLLALVFYVLTCLITMGYVNEKEGRK